MLANEGDHEGLFSAVVLLGGATLPVGDLSLGQDTYDAVVEAEGCGSSGDTLGPLKELSFDVLKRAFEDASLPVYAQKVRFGLVNGVVG